MKAFARKRQRCWPAILLGLALAGCTTNHYRKSADREAYRTIEEKTPLVQNMDPNFTIESTNALALDLEAVVEAVPEFLGPDGETERGAALLALEDALALAVRHSRSYQSRKEQLYLSALSLTLTRHQFTPLFSANSFANYSVQTEQAVEVGIDEITGQPKIIVSDSLVEQHRVSGGGGINASWLIRDVGRITTSFTADFLRFITGDPRVTTSSQLSATFLRPLLRDAGFKQQTEALIQAERQLLYDLREFTRFRKDFSVQVATAYYGVLGSRDAARNSFLNLQSSRLNAERTRALAQEGRITQADLGRLEQQELSAESAWINAIRGYKQSLDNFKLLLGLPVNANIVLDDRELEALRIEHPEISVEDSIQVALVARLDYLNSKDQLEDAVRRVDLAENFLRPRVDLAASVAINSDPRDNSGFPVPDIDRYRWNAGLNIDPGLDRKAERNAYRASLISRNRAARAIEQQEDEIKLEIRNSWRTLDQAKRNYEISEIGVELAERRVEEQNLLAELGRARAQDQVDAQNAFIDSKNQRTQALVTHTIARLQFWNNMGILYIKDNGQWEELQNAKTP
jgi:outer membrane protein TolC